MPRISVEEAIEKIRVGEMVILVDDEDRENEGDLTMAAEKITPVAVNFMAKLGRGLICLSLTSKICDQLELPSMVENNTSPYQTGFTVSIEAKHGVTTGISAADRATTIQTAVADGATAKDLVRPGHIFPLRVIHGNAESHTGNHGYLGGVYEEARIAIFSKTVIMGQQLIHSLQPTLLGVT